ncbi:MAG: hypothetical protein ACXU86_14225 [Archangium sp.]
MKNALVVMLISMSLGLGCGDDGSRGEGASVTAQAITRVRYDGQTLFRGIYFGRGPVAALLPELWNSETLAQGHWRVQLMTQEELASSLETAVSVLRQQGLPKETLQRLGGMSRHIRENGNPLAQAQMKREASEEMTRAFQEEFIRRIDRMDPSFFARFANDVQSGNQLQVYDGFREGATKLLTVAMASNGRMSSPSDDPLMSLVIATQVAEAAYGVQALGLWNVGAVWTAAVVAVAAVWVVAVVFPIAPPGDGDASAQLRLEQATLVDTLTRHLATPERRED